MVNEMSNTDGNEVCDPSGESNITTEARHSSLRGCCFVKVSVCHTVSTVDDKKGYPEQDKGNNHDKYDLTAF